MSELRCPFCGSTDITRDEVDIGVGIEYGPAGCESCHAYQINAFLDEERTAEERRTHWRRGPLKEGTRVVAAAILSLATDEVFSVPQPGRHHDVIRLMGAKFNQSDEQGFILSDGRFVMRKAALSIAYRTGQLPEGGGVAPQHGLFSEDLW